MQRDNSLVVVLQSHTPLLSCHGNANFYGKCPNYLVKALSSI